MRHLIGLAYLTTSLGGVYWSIYLTMTGIYGVPFSMWYVVVFVGSITLLVGSICWWISARPWTRWLPVIGSVLLVSYFVQVLILGLRTGKLDAIRWLWITLLAFSTFAAIKSRPKTVTSRGGSDQIGGSIV